MKFALQLFFFVLSSTAPMLITASAQAAGAGSGAGGSTGAGSLFSDYTAGVVVYVLLSAFLVAVLLIGGMLIVNFGFLAKRPEDRIGGRTPSDIATFKGNVWPDDVVVRNTLPASETDNDVVTEDIPEKRPDRAA